MTREENFIRYESGELFVALSVVLPMGTDWTRVSLFFQGILFIYYPMIEWVDLFPWNDIRRVTGQESHDLIVAAILGNFITATLWRLRWVMTVGIGLYGSWLWLQIDRWWVSYFRGASPAWKHYYNQFFSKTMNFLPSDGAHLPPDACHMVLQVLIFGSLITISLAVFQLFFKNPVMSKDTSSKHMNEDMQGSDQSFILH